MSMLSLISQDVAKQLYRIISTNQNILKIPYQKFTSFYEEYLNLIQNWREKVQIIQSELKDIEFQMLKRGGNGTSRNFENGGSLNRDVGASDVEECEHLDMSVGMARAARLARLEVKSEGLQCFHEQLQAVAELRRTHEGFKLDVIHCFKSKPRMMSVPSRGSNPSNGGKSDGDQSGQLRNLHDGRRGKQQGHEDEVVEEDEEQLVASSVLQGLQEAYLTFSTSQHVLHNPESPESPESPGAGESVYEANQMRRGYEGYEGKGELGGMYSGRAEVDMDEKQSQIQVEHRQRNPGAHKPSFNRYHSNKNILITFTNP